MIVRWSSDRGNRTRHNLQGHARFAPRESLALRRLAHTPSGVQLADLLAWKPVRTRSA